MKTLLVFFLFLVGCATHDLPTQLAYGKPAVFQHKHTKGDCARFNADEMKRQGKTTDGTIMFINGYMRHKKTNEILYIVTIDHKRLDGPVTFTALVKVFDRDTDKASCPK